MKKNGRNNPCDCGSGKKFKQCCMLREPDTTGVTVQAVAGIPGKNAIAELLASAIAVHQSGNLKEAQDRYEAILQAVPEQPDALHYLGVIAYQNKQYALAEQLMCHSVRINPSNAFYFSNLGMVYRDQKKLIDAIRCQRSAIALKPDYPEALLNLGAALIDHGKFKEGAENCRKALALRPAYVEAYDNLGTALKLQNNYPAAILAYQQAQALNPSYVAAYSNLAAVLILSRDMGGAIKNCLKAAELDPTHANAYYYLGLACQEQENIAGSVQFFRHAAALAPDNNNVQFALSLSMLASGNLEHGWMGYEFRWFKEVAPVARRSFPYPWWQGESLEDKTILIWGEQGVGDQIMFANLYAEMVRRAGQCIFACTKKLIPLFRHSFPAAQIVDVENVPSDLDIHVQSPAGSMARWLRPDNVSFPQESHFLVADPERVAYWRSRLAVSGPELTIGICWRSGDLSGERSSYCSKIGQWGPIFAIPGVRFVNLQYDECSAELAQVRDQFGVEVQVFPEVDLYDDLAETAALTKAVDLVIGAPTAAIILAAALGVETWEMMSGFTWQTFGTTKNCWYADMHLFRKSWEQEWELVVAQIAAALQAKLARTGD